MMNHPLPNFLRKRAKGHHFKKNTHLKIYTGKENFNLGDASENG